MGNIVNKISENCKKMTNYFTSNELNIEILKKDSSIYSKNKSFLLSEILLDSYKNIY